MCCCTTCHLILKHCKYIIWLLPFMSQHLWLISSWLWVIFSQNKEHILFILMYLIVFSVSWGKGLRWIEQHQFSNGQCKLRGNKKTLHHSIHAKTEARSCIAMLTLSYAILYFVHWFYCPTMCQLNDNMDDDVSNIIMVIKNGKQWVTLYIQVFLFCVIAPFSSIIPHKWCSHTLFSDHNTPNNNKKIKKWPWDIAFMFLWFRCSCFLGKISKHRINLVCGWKSVLL